MSETAIQDMSPAVRKAMQLFELKKETILLNEKLTIAQKALIEYAQHKDGCSIQHWNDEEPPSCDCGFDEAMRESGTYDVMRGT